MADTLRPTPVPTPPPGRGQLRPDQLPGEGRPPMKTGRVHMSDFTRRQLELVGWHDGDPIPGDLGQRLHEIQAEVMKEREEARLEDSPMAAGWKPPQASFVNIEDLPPEKQEEIRGYLAEYKQQIEQQQQQAAAIANVDAQIPANIQGPQRDLMRDQILAGEAAMAARRGHQGESIVIDDRETSSAPPPGMPPVPEGKQYAGTLGVAPVAQKIEDLKKQQREGSAKPPEAPTPQPSVPDTEAGARGPVGHCPRCAWRLDMPFDVEPTETDKQGFMASVLGLARFEKKYELLGGKLNVFFRSLTSEESATLQQQLGSMVRSGESIGDGEYWANLMEFRLVLNTSRIEVGGNTIYAAPPLAEWEKVHPPADGSKVLATAIPRMRDYFYANGPTQEPVRRILGQTHRLFQRLVEMLETMTNDPDFWQGIELPG